MDVESYIRPLHFRLYTAADFDACVALYASNEPDHVPKGYRPDFEQWLTDGEALILIAESDSVPVACGGIAYQHSPAVAALTFGIVDAQHHRRGFGTTLLMARLALLNPDPDGCTVGMEVTSTSFSFYRRFGFQGYDVSSDERGSCFGQFSRTITPTDVAQCRRLLAQAGATLPSDYVIPSGHFIT
jgi:ribosomal protein S18 acetylase RimI-like enzyme